MLRRILVGLDGSQCSSAATEFSLQLSRQFNAQVVGLSVVDEQTIRAPEPVPLGAGHFKTDRDKSLLADAHCKVESILAKFSNRCQAEGVENATVKSTGLPSKEILLQAQSHDLIVLGQRTYFHFETHSRACETLTTVLRSSPRPIIAVPEQYRTGDTILVAFNGSLPATRSMQLFQSLQLAGNQSLHVISIDADYETAVTCAERAAQYLEQHQTEVNRLPIASYASPANVILEQIDELNPSLLVIGAFGQSVLREFIHGSTTLKLLDESRVPVFVYH